MTKPRVTHDGRRWQGASLFGRSLHERNHMVTVPPDQCALANRRYSNRNFRQSSRAGTPFVLSSRFDQRSNTC
jgi:hypothetical protein